MTDTNHDEEAEVSKMTEEEPVESAESWKLKGDEFYRSKLYSKAIEAYSNAITYQVGLNANYYSNRAASYLMIGSFQDALKDCDTAVNIEPNNPKIYFRRATILKSLGRFDDSIKSLTDGLALDATSVTAKADLDSLNLLKQQIVGLHTKVSKKQYRAVLPEIDAVIRTVGSRVRELNLLKARVLIELQRAPEAYNLTNAMMREHGSNADSELIVLRARCLYISGDLENAIKHLQQSLRLDPDCKSSRDFLKRTREIEEKKEAGNAAFKAAAYQISIDLWTESINLDNQNQSVTTKLYCNRAAAFSMLKDHASAVKDSTLAIALNPQYAKAYIRRADSYYSLGGKENLLKSINDYQKALEFQTDEKGTESLNSKIKKAKVAHKRSGKKDLYGTLGIVQGASDDEIKKAYRKAALKYHPDKQASKGDDEKASAEKMFREVGEAYEVLSDPEKKKKYDEGVDVEDLDRPGCGGGFGHGGHGHGGHGHGGMPGGMDPNILFQMYMQQQMHGRG